MALSANASMLEVTPVQKVLQLLNGMMEKGKEEKHKEQVLFAASRQFCGDNEVKTKSAIKEEIADIRGLTALIRKDRADAAHLTKLISFLDEDQDIWSGDIKAATKVRAIEKADYDKMHQDYSESIDAVGRAVSVMKKQSHDRTQKKAALLQVSSALLIPDGMKKTIETFLQQGDSEYAEDLAAPEANAYEFQSNGVVDMLEKLGDKFSDERMTLEKEEANGKNAYSLLMQNLKAEIVQAIKEKHGKSLSKAKALQRKGDEKGDRKSVQGLNKVDETSLSDLKAACAMKSSDFQARQQLRTEEIEAIEKAIEIIAGGAVSGNAKKHLPGFVQQGTSLGQLRSDSSSSTQMHQRVAEFLRARAKAMDSRVLAAVALRAAADPFQKVKKMIKGLVVRLMEEANEEAEHKGWCDTELSTNAQTRQEKTEAVESLQAEIDSLGASIAKLTQKVSDITGQISDLDKAVSKSTEIRTAEKSANKEAISDAQAAQTAIAQALIILREFYAKAAEATAFVQAPYKGMGDSNTGVVAMLEVIESDFARLESETQTSEASSQKEYDSFMSDSKADKAAKSTAAEHKAAKKQGESQALTEKKNDLLGTQKELDAALSYYDKLRPTCVDAGASYEDRVARRKAEIESLQGALKIINGEDIA